jgi:hypothetical protein
MWQFSTFGHCFVVVACFIMQTFILLRLTLTLKDAMTTCLSSCQPLTSLWPSSAQITGTGFGFVFKYIVNSNPCEMTSWTEHEKAV